MFSSDVLYIHIYQKLTQQYVFIHTCTYTCIDIYRYICDDNKEKETINVRMGVYRRDGRKATWDGVVCGKGYNYI